MKPETLTHCGSHVSALTGERLNRGEVAPIFSPTLDGRMEKQTDSSCTRKDRQREKEREGMCVCVCVCETEKEREREGVKGREEGGVTYL